MSLVSCKHFYDKTKMIILDFCVLILVQIKNQKCLERLRSTISSARKLNAS